MKNGKMPYKSFSCDQVVDLCFEISMEENLFVEVATKRRNSIYETDEDETAQRKTSIFKLNNNNSENNKRLGRKTSAIASNLNLANGIPTSDAAQTKITNGGLNQRIEREVELRAKIDEQRHIVGLNGRGVVAVAILCDETGQPFRTYSEDDDIPVEEIEHADKVFLSQVPRTTNNVKRGATVNSSNETTQSLPVVLARLNSNKKCLLSDKMEKTLDQLRTTDYNTASMFLKLDKYETLRQEIRKHLIEFFTGDLKLPVYNSNQVKITVNT